MPNIPATEAVFDALAAQSMLYYTQEASLYFSDCVDRPVRKLRYPLHASNQFEIPLSTLLMGALHPVQNRSEL